MSQTSARTHPSFFNGNGGVIKQQDIIHVTEIYLLLLLSMFPYSSYKGACIFTFPIIVCKRKICQDALAGIQSEYSSFTELNYNCF